MKLHLASNIRTPNFSEWKRFFPKGVGPSAFSAPAWQQIMAKEVGAEWKLRHLHNHPDEKAVVLPVFVRRNRWERHDITVQPVAYYVTPLACSEIDAETVHAILSASSSMRTSMFTWWLPPWSSWQPNQLDQELFGGFVTQSATETYVIELRQPLEEYLAKNVSKTQTWQARTSIKRGLVIVENPSSALVEEYYSLYLRVRGEEEWQDKPFSNQFFHDAATTLEDGGRLIVMQYEGKVIGGGVLLFDHQAVHYFQGTTDRAIKNVFPHSVLCAEALKAATARGLQFVNLGGVNDGNDGLIKFKLSWGAVPKPVPFLQWRCNVAKAIRSLF